MDNAIVPSTRILARLTSRRRLLSGGAALLAGVAVAGLNNPAALAARSADHGGDDTHGEHGGRDDHPGDGNMGQTILEFATMAGVTGPFVGTANPIRGISGGGLPWVLSRAEGELKADGRLEVHVRGLVLAAGAAAGTNPVSSFLAVVSCMSIDAMGNPSTVNVATSPFPASSTGDADVEATLSLPHPCFAPIIFITSPTMSWFAVTGM